MKVLFVVFDGGGNIPPQLAVARALRARGAEVRFLGHHGVRQRVEADGFPVETFRAGTNFDPTVQRPLLPMMISMTRVAMDRRLGREAVRAAHRHRRRFARRNPEPCRPPRKARAGCFTRTRPRAARQDAR